MNIIFKETLKEKDREKARELFETAYESCMKINELFKKIKRALENDIQEAKKESLEKAGTVLKNMGSHLFVYTVHLEFLMKYISFENFEGMVSSNKKILDEIDQLQIKISLALEGK